MIERTKKYSAVVVIGLILAFGMLSFAMAGQGDLVWQKGI
jgi:hypothetical protein